MTERRIAVVGGGLAGITAALDCSRAGAEVILLESRGRLGGQVYSFTRDGLQIDNGQHVFLRCCTAYRALLEQIGAVDMVTLQPRLELPVLAPNGRRAVLRRANLPAPFHMALSLARYGMLSAADRLSAARAMRALGAVDRDDPAVDAQSLGGWLAARHQSPEACAALWELIARPTLNLRAADASLAQAAQVFQVGLLTDSAGGDVGYARVPLSRIHDQAARRALEGAGVQIRLRCGVTAITPVADGFELEISGAPTVAADTVILAVPPDRCAQLLPPGCGIAPGNLLSLGRSPIVNLHVLYDRRVLDAPFAAGVHSPVQWLFDRTTSSGCTEGQYLAVSLSAADDELALSVEQLRARYEPALAELLGTDAEIRKFFVTRDHAATFRAAPGSRAMRPGTRTKLPGLFLAGSWTDTGWPATMEGAVRSGHAAAREALPASDSRDSNLVILAPMALEARAVRSGAPWAQVKRLGVGPRRAARAPQIDGIGAGTPVLLAGFCGALDDRLKPGDVVIADELRTAGGVSIDCPDPTVLAGVLRRAGARVHVGPIVSGRGPVTGKHRRRMEGEALAVDMESAFAARALAPRPCHVLRVVLDDRRHELYRPLRATAATLAAYRALRNACAALEDWARELGARELVLASPRASCAGVERAIRVVERVLEERGSPVYVRKQIVHNAHVIADLEARGAVFVEEVDEVPPGETLIFSAHGVSPEVRRRADARELSVIDATCPLVSKVHAEARRFNAHGYQIVLVGHEGHEEVEGTYGEAPERTQVVADASEVAQLELEDPERVAYLTQTTLALDDTADVIDALRRRYPTAKGPASSDICYATQNRQDAVRALAADCDLVLVIGSQNSSNSRRLVEVAERAGAPAVLIDDASEITPRQLHGVARIGVTAGASAPEALVAAVVRALSGLGEVAVTERSVATEDVHFKLPVAVREVR